MSRPDRQPQARDRIIDDLRSALGPAGLQVLLQQFGGTRLHVHRCPRPGSDLARVLGPETYGRLQRRFAGEALDLPQLPRPTARDLVHALRAEGLTGNRIARAAGLSLRYVRRILSERGPDPSRTEAAPMSPPRVT